MSAGSLFLWSGYDGPLSIKPDEDPQDPCVWIWSQKSQIRLALTLSREDRQKMRQALDAIDAREAAADAQRVAA